MSELNRKTFDRLLGPDANDDLFEYVKKSNATTKCGTCLGFDPLLREYYAFGSRPAGLE